MILRHWLCGLPKTRYNQYIGYGLSESDIINNAKYGLVYTVAIPLSTDTTVIPAVANGATGVKINTPIAATFSVEMDPAGFTPMTVTVMQGDTPVPGTLSYSGSTLLFTPSGALANNTSYTATIKGGADGVKDLAGNSLSGDLVWNWTTGGLSDTIAPTVRSAIIDGAANVPVNTAVNASFSEAINPTTLTTATVTIMQGTTPVPGTLSYSGSTLVFTPSGTFAANTHYTATIKGGVNGVKDLAGNPLASDFVWSWTTGDLPDTTAPTATPAITDGAANVPVNTAVNATFSEAMNPVTFTTASVTLMQGTTRILGTLDYSGVDLVFIPSSTLANNTYYTATIKGGVNGVKDLAGNPLASDLVWSWTTVPATAPTDTTAPTVNSAIADGATDVGINTTIAATFSEAMNPASVSAATVTLMQGTTPVPGTLSYSGGNLVFTPSSALANSTDYTATIKGGVNGVKDLAGNPLASDFVWSWTTAAAVAPTDTTAPTVSSAIADGEFYVDVGTSINATFSEPMSSATVNDTTFTLLQGTTPVPGTLSYSGVDLVFTPSSPLAYNKPYTATIKGGSSGVKDVAGNPLTSDLVWSWITHTKPLAVVNLGTAGNFAILSKTGVSSISPSAVTGDIGVSPAALTYITGFSLIADATNVFATSTQVVGKVYAANSAVPTPSNLTTAISDMELAYTDAAGRPTPDFLNLGGGSIGGLTLSPGLYNWGTGVDIPTDVVISGGPTDIWIFQVAGNLNMSSAKRITLSGGALAKNIFWQVAGQAVIGTTAHFEGIILSQTEVILNTGASMNGRALAQTAVTLDSATVTQP